MSDLWGKLRTIGLVVMIVFACLCELILILCQQWWWAAYWGLAVIGGVGLIEILSYISGGKTISTRWKEWAQKNPLWAYLALGSMALSFVGLIVHLAFWGGIFK